MLLSICLSTYSVPYPSFLELSIYYLFFLRRMEKMR